MRRFRCRIILINPPSPYLENDAAYPPSGLLYVAGALESAGHSVSILDLTSHPDWRSELSALEGDLLGITCVTPNVPTVKEMIDLLPRGIPVVVGGPHPTFLPQETLAETGCQAVVRGEGEIAILKVLEDLRQGTLQKVYDGGVVPASRIPLPARHLVDLQKYRPGGEVTTPIYTSRGCPFHCRFCSKITGHRFRVRPLDHVMQEVDEVMSYGYRHVLFADDNIALRPERLAQLLHRLLPLNLHFRLNQDGRRIDPRLLALAREAGCTEISLGIESGSQKMLDRMHKETTVEKNRRFIEEARNHDIRVKAYFIVNFPGESEETVEETLRFAEKARPDKWLLSAFAPLPGSDTFSHPGRYGITWMSPRWEDYYLVGRNGHFRPCFMTEELTFEKQIKLHEKTLKGLSEILGPEQAAAQFPETKVLQAKEEGEARNGVFCHDERSSRIGDHPLP